MSRSVTLFTAQWADLTLEDVCVKAKDFGYDGLELACWGDHFEVGKADQAYCDAKRELLRKYDLELFAISNHLVGQAVCDKVDERHKNILPDYVYGDGKSEDVQKRASDEMIKTAEAAKRLGVDIVNGFTGSSIWHLIYPFPPMIPDMIDQGFNDFANRWNPILDAFKDNGVRFGLEVHPTGIAFDIVTAERAVQAVNGHEAFGFNYDPSHLGYQGVDYVAFIRRFPDRIFAVHLKDVAWSNNQVDSGVFGGHLEFGDNRRFWNFRSLGRGNINFEEIIRALNDIHYSGPLSIEWEDNGMDRETGAAEAAAFAKSVDFGRSEVSFDSSFKE
ncbi:MAG: sugar phosphate isomerase/epimerase [Candidatus Peribacteraceae bacterium]|jgi:sugar phosphate isomerase/epimerase|nr:sugar phosphate isomerase/epimerase [Candidatus Peribacteraceae bacterium]|tara:strand:- start:15970 stop:16962 length:993 start_codon:yes stop_codon:yes gene_type:complete